MGLIKFGKKRDECDCHDDASGIHLFKADEPDWCDCKYEDWDGGVMGWVFHVKYCHRE